MLAISAMAMGDPLPTLNASHTANSLSSTVTKRVGDVADVHEIPLLLPVFED